MGYGRLVAFLTLVNATVAQTVVVHPKLINDVLVNPGMGIQTFQRFNGDALNAGVKWSEEGPTEALAANGSAVDFPRSTIAYCRWFWETLEPEQGKVRWEILDRALADAARHGQQLAIRLMPYDQKHPLPQWYQASGAKRANNKGDPIWEPDFSDALYLKYWGAVVQEAGRRYDGNPNLDTVDISSVGYWGEGWSNYMPAWTVEKQLTDIWIAAFPSTHLLMNFDEPEALRYGTAQGAGWRFDCVGDLRAKWSHMLDFYPRQIVRAGIEDIWKRSPCVHGNLRCAGFVETAGLGRPIHSGGSIAMARYFTERQVERHPTGLEAGLLTNSRKKWVIDSNCAGLNTQGRFVQRAMCR